MRRTPTPGHLGAVVVVEAIVIIIDNADILYARVQTYV